MSEMRRTDSVLFHMRRGDTEGPADEARVLHLRAKCVVSRWAIEKKQAIAIGKPEDAMGDFLAVLVEFGELPDFLDMLEHEGVTPENFSDVALNEPSAEAMGLLQNHGYKPLVLS